MTKIRLTHGKRFLGVAGAFENSYSVGNKLINLGKLLKNSFDGTPYNIYSSFSVGSNKMGFYAGDFFSFSDRGIRIIEQKGNPDLVRKVKNMKGIEEFGEVLADKGFIVPDTWTGNGHRNTYGDYIPNYGLTSYDNYCLFRYSLPGQEVLHRHDYFMDFPGEITQVDIYTFPKHLPKKQFNLEIIGVPWILTGEQELPIKVLVDVRGKEKDKVCDEIRRIIK